MITKVSSMTQEIEIGPGRPTVLIGERINPTGKKKLTAALKAGDFDLVAAEAEAQVAAGADILDINTGIDGGDEARLLSEAVKVVMAVTDVPLCLDSNSPLALEAALEVYQGKALINSVSAETESLKSVLPLAKKYGAAVVGLTVDDEGIPKDAESRLSLAAKIISAAEEAGLDRSEVIIDSLVMTIGADNKAGLTTLEAVSRIRDELGVNQTCGGSNISFGVPDRELLNNAFLALAIAAGITCPIVDVQKARPAILAADLALGKDAYAKRYSQAYRERLQAG